MKKFNCIIRDRHFQELHHALGCPWPDEIMGETYRNYFAVDATSKEADRFRSSPHWTNGTEKFGMDCFHVTKEGRRALIEHMRDHIDIPCRYRVTFKHHDGDAIVAAKSRSSAKYAAYIDADIDLPFIEYAAKIKSVQLYSRARPSAQA